MKKKLLFVITKSNWGGAQKHTYDLAEHFSKDFDVAVAMGGTGVPSSPPGLLWEKLKIILPAHNLIFLARIGRDISIASDLAALRELYLLMRARKPDIVHLHSSKMATYGAIAARVAGVPVIISTIHGWAFNEDRSLIAKAILYVIHLLGVLASTRTIVINTADERTGRSMPFCARKIVRVYNGLKPSVPLSPEEAREELARRFAIPRNVPLMGSIGELTKNKGYRHALDACEALLREGVPFSYLIIGEGDERKNLTKEIALRGLFRHVLLAGFLPNAAQYLRAFDIFLLPSVKEGLPSVLLEAGMAGVACVASDIPGSSDIIKDGTSGRLVPPRNGEALARAAAALLADQNTRTAMGAQLRIQVATAFSFERMVQAIRELYRS